MEIKLGDNIRRLRKEAGLTQEQLAEAMGVTTGAVYKWESGKATPELELLVEIAEFFETSVDALLDYGWEKLSMGKTVKRLRRFIVDRELEEGRRFAEKALQKFSNSFDVVYNSAVAYFLSPDLKCLPRAVELFEKAIDLIDQNTNDEVSAVAIQANIAACYYRMGRRDEAVALLKKHNVNGMNNAAIGLMLSNDAQKAEEALEYLSASLGGCYSQLFNTCIGYANAYGVQGKTEKVTELILWLHELGKGLRDTTVINWIDRGDVKLFLILAEMDYRRGDEQGALDWLTRAKRSALKFDSAPDYHMGAGLKFYHGNENATAYDDLGETAMEMIENHMSEDEDGKNLLPLWEKLCAEESMQHGEL